MTWGWKVWCVLGLFSLFTVTGIAAPQYAFRIQFKDKQGSPSLANPLVFLSQRALDRRTAQSISLDSTDQPVVQAYVDDVISNTSGKFHSASKWMNSCVILLTDSSQILNIQSKPYIADITYVGYFPSGLHKSTSGTGGQIAGTSKTTASQSYYGASFEQTQLVNGGYLHDRSYKGSGKLIAVFDEGFAGVNTIDVFNSLMTSGRLVDTRNFVLASNDVFSSYTHGTQCLSTIAADKPGVFVGSAPEASYALYVTEYSFADYPIEMDDLAAGIERADSIGGDVISASIGYNWFSGSFPDLTYNDIDGKSTVAARAVNMASAKGMVCVISAGNEGGNSWNNILTPGDADSALTVGSVSSSGDVASTSGYGPNSSGIRKPDVCMLGNPAAIVTNSGSPSVASGTSFATPQLAGWVACLWQSSPHSTSTQIRDAVRKSAHRYNNPDNHIGYGIPNFYRASENLNISNSGTVVHKDAWIIVAPNPVNTNLNIVLRLEKPENIVFSITDITGKVISGSTHQGVIGEQTILLPVSSLSKGVYFLKASAPDRQQTVRFVMP